MKHGWDTEGRGGRRWASWPKVPPSPRPSPPGEGAAAPEQSVFNPCFIRGSKSFGKAEGRRQKAEKSKRLRRILVSGFFILPSSLACRRSLAVERGEHGVGRRVVAARAGGLDVEQGGL